MTPSRPIATAAAMAACCIVASEVFCQVDTTLSNGIVLAEFADAAAVAVDPNGDVFVVDASKSTLTRLRPDGQLIAVYGGPGSGEYEFDSPEDIDVSAGFVWVVADAGNGRVKRFSSEFLHLQSIPLDLSSFAVTQSAGAGGFREEEGDPLRYAGGRPVAVAANLSDETFAIDVNRRVVVKWNPARRIERVFGGPADLRGALVDPLGLAIDKEGRVYVADKGQDAVLVYDRFGTFMRRIGDGLLKDVVEVSVVGERLLVIMPEHVSVYSPAGMLVGRYRLELGEPLRDVSVADGAFMVLTERRLIRVPF